MEGYESPPRRHIAPKTGRLKMESLCRTQVERIHRTIGLPHPGAANRALALLRAVCAKSEIWGSRDQNSNPRRGARRFREEPKKRPLSLEERTRLDAVLVEDGRAPLRKKLHNRGRPQVRVRRPRSLLNPSATLTSYGPTRHQSRPAHAGTRRDSASAPPAPPSTNPAAHLHPTDPCPRVALRGRRRFASPTRRCSTR